MRNSNYLNVFDFLDELEKGFGMFSTRTPLLPPVAPRWERQLASDDVPANIYREEESKDFVIEFAMAGLSREDIDITLEGRYIKVTPLKKEAKEIKKYEFMHGLKAIKGNISFNIPKIYDLDQISAKMENGLLTIRIKKLPAEAQLTSRKIPLLESK
jgi:HSP20 family molecular chaperone IbpA